MRRVALLAVAALLLAGCAKTPQPQVAATLAGPLHVREGVIAPTAADNPPFDSETTPGQGPSNRPAVIPGQCDAASLAYLIGRPRTEIPVPADLSRRWVSCATCAPPDDHRPDRTDILFNAETGLIVSISCG